MHVRILYATAFVLCGAWSAQTAAQESLLTIRSKDGGADFDLTVTEIKREPRKSFLVVPGFSHRSAAGSRWLMCAYTALAMRRGFSYWSVVYPEGSSETLVVGFPETPTEDISKTLGSEFSGPLVTPE